jgi:hypothetical protein
MPLKKSTIFQLYRSSNFIGGGNWGTPRKRPTCRKYSQYTTISEWLLCNAEWTIFQLYHDGWEHVTFRWDDDVRFVLDQHALLNFYCEWNNILWIEMSFHYDTLSRFLTKQSYTSKKTQSISIASNG